MVPLTKKQVLPCINYFIIVHFLFCFLLCVIYETIFLIVCPNVLHKSAWDYIILSGRRLIVKNMAIVILKVFKDYLKACS